VAAVDGGWGIGALDGLEAGYLEALGAVAFMAADLEVVERLMAAAAGLADVTIDPARRHDLAEPVRERCTGLVPRRLSDDEFLALVAWAGSLPGVFERRRRILHASRIRVRTSGRLPRTQTTLRRLRLYLRDTPSPPTTSELRAFVGELGDLAQAGWDLLQKAWPDTAAFRRPG
jgi:hypothetical protein